MGKASERVAQQRQAVVEDILACMEKGELDWAEDVFGGVGPRNYVSERAYRGRNRLHLGYVMRKRGYDDPRFLTFKQARERGLSVRKGEKGSIVEHWKNVRVGDSEQDEAAEVFPVLVGYWRVFNVEQCDGEIEPPLTGAQPDAELSALADEVLAASPCAVRIREASCPCYRPREDVIEIYAKERSRSINSWLRVLLHEMTHATGHDSRLGRDVLNFFGTPSYAREELVAELGAAFLASDLGLPRSTETDAAARAHAESHAAYLKEWMRVLRSDADELFKAAAKADAAAAWLMARVEAGREARELAA